MPPSVRDAGFSAWMGNLHQAKQTQSLDEELVGDSHLMLAQRNQDVPLWLLAAFHGRAGTDSVVDLD